MAKAYYIAAPLIVSKTIEILVGVEGKSEAGVTSNCLMKHMA